MKARLRPISLRARMGLASGVAVALAVFAVAISAYAGTRSELRGQVDNALQQRLNSLPADLGGAGGGPPGGRPGPQIGAAFGQATGGDCDQGLGFDQGRGRFGGESAFVQIVNPSGVPCLPANAAGTEKLPVDSNMRAIAARGQGRYLADVHVGRTHIRVLAVGIGSRGAVELALPLTDVDHALTSQLLLLVVIAAAGIALAGLLGILVARTALAPIARFTRRTESIAAHPERPNQRLEEEGGDELARLAQTFNTTLDALERSVQSQRNLVADASHELRTPIATLRANLQLMRDESRLSSEDRAALREDMIDELDELTGLVGDVVELARGSKPTGARGDVRVDAIVEDLAERTRRRAPQLAVLTRLQPTLVRGESDRIARALANLLDNARKWSPPGGVIELTLQAGTLTVRDSGPGFQEEDLPFVFDRFHRAREARSKPGSGLGLAIARQAAEAHGGHVEAANAPGGGALLRISFGPVLDIDDPSSLGSEAAAVSR